jgi:hypothetical protein
VGLIRTYVDAGVLIAAARSASHLSNAALSVLDDPSREFVGSDYLRLEVLPKAHYHHSVAELALYEEFFSTAAMLIAFDARHFEVAFQCACTYGLSAFDALHLIAATTGQCVEFVTSERPASPVFRFPGIKIRTIC